MKSPSLAMDNCGDIWWDSKGRDKGCLAMDAGRFDPVKTFDASARRQKVDQECDGRWRIGDIAALECHKESSSLAYVDLFFFSASYLLPD
jgi:hypothetical protein